jgi:TatD DNase family protein
MTDTHCHIDLYDRPLEIAQSAEKLGVRTVAVTYLPSHFALAVAHLSGFKHVQPALGLHPLAIKDHEAEIHLFGKHFPSAKYIGEVGLDFSGPNKDSKQAQERSFSIVVDHIRKTKKFTTVHSRGAEDAVLAILQSGHSGPVVFHWFSGSKRQLGSILDAGHRVSLNTAMSATAKWAEFIRYVPRTAILTETDGPFVKIAGRPVVPGDVSIVVSWLAEKWKLSIAEASKQVADNLNRLMTDLQIEPFRASR